MKNKFYLLIFTISIFSIGLSDVKKVYKNKIAETDKEIKNWEDEDKTIKDPELQKVLEQLRNEFKFDREELKKDYKKRIDLLKKDYKERRKKIKKEYYKNNPDKKPRSLNPYKKKKMNDPDKAEKKKPTQIKNNY